MSTLFHLHCKQLHHLLLAIRTALASNASRARARHGVGLAETRRERVKQGVPSTVADRPDETCVALCREARTAVTAQLEGVQAAAEEALEQAVAAPDRIAKSISTKVSAELTAARATVEDMVVKAKAKRDELLG